MVIVSWFLQARNSELTLDFSHVRSECQQGWQPWEGPHPRWPTHLAASQKPLSIGVLRHSRASSEDSRSKPSDGSQPQGVSPSLQLIRSSSLTPDNRAEVCLLKGGGPKGTQSPITAPRGQCEVSTWQRAQPQTTQLFPVISHVTLKYFKNFSSRHNSAHL